MLLVKCKVESLVRFRSDAFTLIGPNDIVQEYRDGQPIEDDMMDIHEQVHPVRRLDDLYPVQTVVEQVESPDALLQRCHVGRFLHGGQRDHCRLVVVALLQDVALLQHQPRLEVVVSIDGLTQRLHQPCGIHVVKLVETGNIILGRRRVCFPAEIEAALVFCQRIILLTRIRLQPTAVSRMAVECSHVADSRRPHDVAHLHLQTRLLMDGSTQPHG